MRSVAGEREVVGKQARQASLWKRGYQDEERQDPKERRQVMVRSLLQPPFLDKAEFHNAGCKLEEAGRRSLAQREGFSIAWSDEVCFAHLSFLCFD